MFEKQNDSLRSEAKKTYSTPELKEWGSIADITLGDGGKFRDTDAVYDATSWQFPV